MAANARVNPVSSSDKEHKAVGSGDIVSKWIQIVILEESTASINVSKIHYIGGEKVHEKVISSTNW